MLDRHRYTESEIDKILESMTILTDSREQKNDHILSYFDQHKICHKKMGLPCGDYSFMLPAAPELGIARDKYFFDEVFIERKNSAEELSGCFTQTRTRFEEEFAVAKAKRKYLLIENCQYSDIISGNYRTDYGAKSFAATLHTFNCKYSLEVVFMPDISYTPIFIIGTFRYYLRYILK
ncbi:MAG: ERCC4 domain-containing protein [Enterocloster asparagiformis]|nr:ERCC4 domain-containing protein [Enterocloster asparagiformis]